jgi:hypothetical protein
MARPQLAKADTAFPGAPLAVDLRTSGRERRPRELHAIMVDAIDDRAMKFYRSFGFVSLSPDAPRRMYIPVATALKVVET